MIGVKDFCVFVNIDDEDECCDVYDVCERGDDGEFVGFWLPTTGPEGAPTEVRVEGVADTVRRIGIILEDDKKVWSYWSFRWFFYFKDLLVWILDYNHRV